MASDLKLDVRALPSGKRIKNSYFDCGYVTMGGCYATELRSVKYSSTGRCLTAPGQLT